MKSSSHKVSLANRAAKLSGDKRNLLAKLLGKKGLDISSLPIAVQHRDQDPLPLSFAQQRLWFISQLIPGGRFYTMPMTIRIAGELDTSILEKTVNEIVHRHESLRTTFEEKEGEPVQIVARHDSTSLSVEDLSDVPQMQREGTLWRLMEVELGLPLDLSVGPLLRTRLFRLTHSDHVLLLNMHHIISDGWSLGVLLRELGVLYNAYFLGHPSTLVELDVRYTDYALWQRNWLKNSVFQQQYSYWKRQLTGLATLQLPTDRTRPTMPSFCGQQESRVIPKPVYEALKALCRRQGVTLFMMLLAAFKVLLYRYTGQDDIVVGSAVANRNRKEIEEVVGFFVNMLALRTRPKGSMTFIDMLTDVRKTVLDAFDNQDLPFEKLVEDLNPERDLSRNPLFQVMFVMQNAPKKQLVLPHLTFTRMDTSIHTARLDLEVYVWETSQDLDIRFVWATDLFEKNSIERMLGHYQNLLEGIASNPIQKLSALPIISEAECELLSQQWNGAAQSRVDDETIHSLFAASVLREGGGVAVEFGGELLTYGELDRRSNCLGHYLQGMGVGPEVCVGVCMDRSLEMVVAILGVVKSGGAYVPLDWSYPKSRLAYMLEDTGALVLITRSDLVEKLPGHSAKVICLDVEWPVIEKESEEDVVSGATAKSLAYVMYTSGSTGVPKGVCIEHRSVVRLVKETNYVSWEPGEVVMQFAPISFDASTFEIWGSLLNGGKLVVFPAHMPSLRELGEFIEGRGVTTLWLTASLFHQMVDHQLECFGGVRQLLAGGEALSVVHVEKMLEVLGEGQHLINGYGPTENTTFTCCHVMTSASLLGRSVPIGRPVANTEVYILDGSEQLVPVGVPGELYIGGAGLARGYLGQAELTAEKFIANPFKEGTRLYKSGDQCRWLSDGAIGFMGRKDQQVKIRGHRVELSEIEAVLLEHSLVQQAVITLYPGTTDQAQVAAYVVPVDDAKISVEKVIQEAGSNQIHNVHSKQVVELTRQMRRHVKRRLPDYMSPSSWTVLDSIPLMKNNKVDYSALPTPDIGLNADVEQYEAPRSALENTITRVWEKVLRIRSVGIHDDFFKLGGHSLLGIRLITELEYALEKEIPVSALFRFSTIARMAEAFGNQPPAADKIDFRLSDNTGSFSGGEYRQMLAVLASVPHPQTKPGSMMLTLNTTGSRDPLFWCFNQPTHEPSALANQLGREQPIFAMYSGSRTTTTDPDTFRKLSEALAAHYVAEICDIQPTGPYLIGGNCGGAHVALEIALRLRDQGKDVRKLCLMEYFDSRLFSYTGYVKLLYGNRSELKAYRPFRWRRLGWKKPFKVVPDVEWIPGAHGQFFDMPNVKTLAEKIACFIR